MKVHTLRYFIPCTILFSLLFTMAACSSSSGQPDANVPGITETVSSENPDNSVQDSTVVDSQPESSETPAESDITGIFSKPGGFYEKEFSLVLTPSEGNEIYYTTDGTDPCTSDTAILYTEEISIYNNTGDPNVYSALTDITLAGYWPPQHNVDKGIVIRAVEKTPEGEYGDVITHSYFVGKTADYYSDFRVISMVTDGDYLFNPDTGAYMVGSAYYEWKNSDDYVQLHEADIANPTNYNREGKETEFPVSIQVFDEGNAVYSTNVGARISGNWTRGNAQKSLRLYARKEYGSSKMEYAFFEEMNDINGEIISKFDKVTLWNGGNDQTLHFRDALIQDLAKDLALDFMEAEPYILFINGEFWGFYLLREKAEDYYIQSHYDIDEKDLVVIKNSELDAGEEEDLEEYRDFTIWAATADMTKEENYKTFCERIDIQSFMDYMTVETYTVNNDWANGYINNWIIWRSKTIQPDNPKADGKWRFVLYDLDQTTGLWGSGDTAYYRNFISEMYSDELDFSLPDMLKNLCNNEEFREAFYENYIRIMNTTFSMEQVNEMLDFYSKTYGDAIKATHSRFGMDWAAWSFDYEIENVRNFFRNRPTYAKQQLESFLENAQ